MKELIEFYHGLPTAESLLTKDTDFHWSRVFPHGLGESFKIATPPHAATHGTPWIKEFTRDFGPAVVMPLALLDKGLGFGARAIKQKHFSTFLVQAPGFYTPASCFAKPFVYGTPIMVVEGVLDAEVASLAYPWVLACLTSKVSEAQAFLLSMLTSVVVLSFDNDEAGDKGTKFSIPHLQKWGLRYTDLRPSKRVKDFGELLSLPENQMKAEIDCFAVLLRTKGVVR